MRNILVSLILLVTQAFAVVHAQSKDTRQPSYGHWPDGTRIAWICELGMEGKVRLMIMTPDGKTYPAELECLPKGEKKT